MADRIRLTEKQHSVYLAVVEATKGGKETFAGVLRVANLPRGHVFSCLKPLKDRRILDFGTIRVGGAQKRWVKLLRQVPAHELNVVSRGTYALEQLSPKQFERLGERAQERLIDREDRAVSRAIGQQFDAYDAAMRKALAGVARTGSGRARA